MSTPFDLVASRLSGAHKTRARAGKTSRAVRAHCPICEAHGRSLDVAESAASGMLLLYCHACQADPETILGSLGLNLHDVMPQRPTHHRARGAGGQAGWGSLLAAVEGLHHAHCRVLACAHGGYAEAAMHAMLDAGQAMETIRGMARAALREGRK